MKLAKSSSFSIIPIVVAVLVIVIGMWVSSQWVAWMLGFQKQLGPPDFILNGWPIYPPKFLYWWYWYGVYAPKQFETAAIPIYVSVLLAAGYSISRAVMSGQTSKDPTYRGSARWATINDLEKVNLLQNKGVLVGLTQEKRSRYLRHDGPEHIMVMAPTRSGKGVGIIIPTLLTWPHSVLVTDIKGENWGITAGYRQKCMGNKVLKFDPTNNDGSSARFNPLDEIRLKTPYEVQDIQNIADMLVDPQGTGQLDHWAKTGHALLVGTVLHLKYTLPHATLADVGAFLSNPEKSFEESLNEMLLSLHDVRGVLKEIYGVDSVTHPVVAQSARELLNKSENERSGVLSTAKSFLNLYQDPIIAKNTAVSDFSIADLMNHDSPVSLYLVVPPKDINRTKPLMRMILNQVISNLTDEMKFIEGKAVAGYKHRLLLMLDEFPALGRLDKMESALAFIAGYGIKAVLIIQSLNQLNKTYTKDNSIVDNCHIRIVYTPNDVQTPEFISKMLGNKTVTMESQGFSGGRLGPWLSKVSTHTQYASRELLTPGEVLQIPANEEIIFIAGTPPIKAKKIKYYADGNFKPRVLEAPSRSDAITRKSTDSEMKQHQTYDWEPENSYATEIDTINGNLGFFDDTDQDSAQDHDQTDSQHDHDHGWSGEEDLI